MQQLEAMILYGRLTVSKQPQPGPFNDRILVGMETLKLQGMPYGSFGNSRVIPVKLRSRLQE